jgi:hypothetical protein
MPSIYMLTPVKKVTSDGGRQPHYSFTIVGIIGKPLVSFAFESREEAEKARQQMQDAVTAALAITPLFVR